MCTRPKDQQAKLVGLSEDLGRVQSENAEPRAPIKRERKLRNGNVVAIDAVPLSDEESHGQAPVIVCYQNGNVDCISGDLVGTRWEHTTTSKDEVVEHATLVGSEHARRGLLKGREDIMALLDTTAASSASASSSSLLCQVVRSQTSRELRISALRNVGATGLQGQRSALEEIVKYELQSRPGEGELAYELHAGSGLLYQRIGHSLTVFDLSGTVPKISFEAGKKASQHIDSFARLSAGAVITVSQGRVAVFDTKFGSILDSVQLPTASSSKSGNASLRLISNFADLGLLVAIYGQDLVAMQLGEVLEDARRSKEQGALLSEVMGKGKHTKEAQQLDAVEKSEKKRLNWEKWTTTVDQLASNHDLAGLEKRLAKDIQYKPSIEAGSNDLTLQLDGAVLQSAAADSAEWELLPQHYDPQHVNRRKAVYLLGKVFAWLPKSSGFLLGQKHIRVVLPSSNILRWLALAGYLTTSEVVHALPQFSGRPCLAAGEIVRTVSEVDPSYELLRSLLSLPAFWSLAEIVQALKVLIESFDDQFDSDVAQQLLKDGDVSMTDADGVDEDKSAAQLQAEEAAALKEVERVTNFLEAGLSTRSAAFRKCLDRLQEFPHKDIAKTMRAQLTQEEIIFFIHIMRVELVNGGWTKMYDGTTDDQFEEDFADIGDAIELSPSNQAIRTIASLISCSVDAVGLSGWLVGQSGNTWSTEDLIESMLNETSAVVEGIYHAENLDIALRELERTAATSQPPKRKHAEIEWTPEQVLMPLGGRTGPPVVNGRRRKAIVAEQKSRSLGKYSFEKIRI